MLSALRFYSIMCSLNSTVGVLVKQAVSRSSKFTKATVSVLLLPVYPLGRAYGTADT